jgi:hypothetical protein
MSGRRDHAIVIAVIGVLLAIGIPALDRGQWVVGGLCLVCAAAVAAWALLSIRRQ